MKHFSNYTNNKMFTINIAPVSRGYKLYIKETFY